MQKDKCCGAGGGVGVGVGVAHCGIKEVCVCTIYNLVSPSKETSVSPLASGCVAELIPQGSPTLRVSRQQGRQIIINVTPAGITQKALLIWAELLPSANDCGNLNGLLLCDWLPSYR